MRACLVLFGAVWASTAFAFDPVPAASFEKPTPDGTRVLVMINSASFGRGPELKAKYGRSGLYPKGDSKNPLWTCDWVAERPESVFASDDGAWAVRVPDGDAAQRWWALSNRGDEPPPRADGWDAAPALLVYQNGKLARTFAVRDLFKSSRFTDTDCFIGPVFAVESFLDAAGRVTVATTADGEKLTATVDFRTGEVVARTGAGGAGAEGGRGRLWPVFAALGGLVGVVVAVLALRARRLARRG